MARLHQFLHSVISGYGVLGANVLYTLFSIPMALSFLPKEEFGVWAIAVQVCMYLTLVDFGLSTSMTRILVDYKDRGVEGGYAGVIKSGWFVMLGQATLMLGIGGAVSYLLPDWLGVPSHWQHEFRVVLIWQVVTFSLLLGLGVFSQILDAHQRQYVGNYGRILQFALGGLILWLGFRMGLGIYALPLANLLGGLGFIVLTVGATIFCRLFPREVWTAPFSYSAIREVFSLGRDVFLITAGALLMMGTQTVLVGRSMGMDAAATWSVGTRVFTLIVQLITRTFDQSLSAFAEMMVRNERRRMQQRFVALVSAITAVSVVAATAMALINAVFVTLWTGGRIQWSGRLDVFLGIWLVVLAVTHCNGMFTLTTKRIHAMRYVYLLEGLLFILVAPMTMARFGVAGMIMCSSVLAILVHGTYGVVRVCGFLGLSISVFVRTWGIVLLKMVLGLLPCVIVLVLARPWMGAVVYFAVSSLLVSVLGVYLALRVAIAEDVWREIVAVVLKKPRDVKEAGSSGGTV